MKALILAAGYFQEDLNINPTNFYLTFPKPMMNIMKNQIKYKKVEFNNLKETPSNNPLPKNAHQIILGSLLGDMHCKKESSNSNLEESHAINQKDYLGWKHSILKNYLDLRLYGFNSSVCKAKGKTYFRKPEIRLRSKVSERLNIYHDLFYKSNKKIINQNLLDQLDTLGLAVWYCDDGYYDPENRTAEIHTESFSIEENKILMRWFNERWNINVNFKKDPSKKKVLLRFPVKETDKFFNLIKEHIFDMPQSMWYKLGHHWKGNIARIDKAKLNKSRRTKIYQSKEEVKIRRNQQATEFYHRNRERILKEKSKYHKTKKYKEYIKKYSQLSDVKERARERQKAYRQNPEYRTKRTLYQKEYRKRPEVRAKVKEYNKRARKKRKKGGQS